MSDVFISYSRQDEVFARRLHAALTDKQLDTWIDWEDIPLTADWWEEIKSGIEAADNFVFIISPAALASPVCHLEIDYALEFNKRVIPCIWQEAEAESALGRLAALKLDESTQERLDNRDLMVMARANWQTLSRHNWLFFSDDETGFNTKFNDLLTALNADLEHTRDHTRLLTRALEWDANARETSFLLDGAEIDRAERWLAQAADKEPEVTELHGEYILASREAERQRQRQNTRRLQLFVGALGILLIVALIAAVGAVDGQNRANESAATAVQSQRQAEQGATRVAEQADVIRAQAEIAADIRISQSEEASQSGAPHHALLLGLESLRNYPTIYDDESHERLTTALDDPIQQVGFFPSARGIYVTPTDTYYLVDSPENFNNLELWDDKNTLVTTLKHDDYPKKIDWYSERMWIVTQTENRDENVATIHIWDTRGNLLQSLPHTFGFDGNWHIDDNYILTWDNYRYTEGSREVWIWNHDGRLLHQLEHEGAVIGVHENADESRILTWSTNYRGRGEMAHWVNLWDLAGNLLLSVEHPDLLEPIGADWNADETQLIAWFRGNGYVEIGVWNMEGNLLDTLTYEGLEFESVFGWSAPSGDYEQPIIWNDMMTLALSRYANIAQVWNLETGAVIELAHDNDVLGLEWHTTLNQIRSWTTSGTIYLWDVHGTEISKAEYPHNTNMKGLAWNSDESRIVTWNEANKAYIWTTPQDIDAATLIAPTHSFTQTEGIHNMLWANDGQHIIVISPNSIWLWDTRADYLTTLPYYTDVWGSRWNPDKTQLLTWSEDGTARIWDAQGQPIMTLNHNSPVPGAFWSIDGSHILTWSQYANVHVWDALSGDQRLVLDHDGVTGATWNSDESKILSWGEDAVRIWDMQGQEQVRLDHEDLVLGAAWQANETRIMTWSVDDVHVWDPSNQQLLYNLPHSDNGYYVLGAAWSDSTSRILTWDEYEIVRLWDTLGNELKSIDMGGSVRGAQWNHDASQIMIWTTDRFEIWDADGQSILSEAGDFGNFEYLGPSWNADESQIITWNGSTVKVLDTSGQPLITMEAVDFVIGATWTMNESNLVTWTNTTTQIWDTAGNLLDTLEHPLGVAGIIWADVDGIFPRLVPVAVDDTQQIWPATIPELIKLACEYKIREFTPEEREQYFLNPNETTQQICNQWADA